MTWGKSWHHICCICSIYLTHRIHNILRVYCTYHLTSGDGPTSLDFYKGVIRHLYISCHPWIYFLFHHLRIFLWRTSYLSFTLSCFAVISCGSISLSSLPHMWISRIIPQKVGVLQHLTWEDILEWTEDIQRLILPTRFKFFLCTPLVHVICKNYIQFHGMDYWWMTVLPYLTFYATILDAMANWINMLICT